MKSSTPAHEVITDEQLKLKNCLDEFKDAEDCLAKAEAEIANIKFQLGKIEDELKSTNMESIQKQLTAAEELKDQAKAIIEDIKNRTVFGAAERGYFSFLISGLITIGIVTAFPQLLAPVAIKILTVLLIGGITGTNSYMGRRAEKNAALLLATEEEKYKGLKTAFLFESMEFESTHHQKYKKEVEQFKKLKDLKAAEERAREARIYVIKSEAKLTEARNKATAALNNNAPATLFWQDAKKPAPLAENSTAKTPGLRLTTTAS